jgi:DNA-directed RNA polymerase specialized sigma24 family protein
VVTRRGEEDAKAEPEVEARYRAAVDALPGPVRTAFLLHRAKGLDLAVVAARMGVPSTTVEAHIAQALVAIAAAIDGVS